MNFDLPDWLVDMIIDMFLSEESELRAAFNHPNYLTRRDKETEKRYHDVLFALKFFAANRDMELKFLNEMSYNHVMKLLYPGWIPT